MSVVAIVQARLGSTRLPGKTLAEVEGRPAIWHLMRRLESIRVLDGRVLAIPVGEGDDALATYAQEQGWSSFRGSEGDVLDRTFRAALDWGCREGDAVVRVTGDDILCDPRLVNVVVQAFLACRPEVQFACNNVVPRFPYGADVEVLSFEALRTAWQESCEPVDREHVTPFIRRQPGRFPSVELRLSVDHSKVHFSIDRAEDLVFNRRIYDVQRQAGRLFGYLDVLRCIEEQGIVPPT